MRTKRTRWRMSRRYATPILLRPRPQAARRLSRWAGARRAVYNAVLQQWRWRYPNRGYAAQTYAGVCRELTELRAALPYFAAVPVHVLQQAAKDALAAIQRFYTGQTKSPRFLAKKRDTDRLRFPDPHTFALDVAGRRVKLPKLGWVTARFPRPLHDGDRVTSLTVVWDPVRETWSAMAAIEGPLPPTRVAETPLLGVDLGVAHAATTSDGQHYAVRDETPDERAFRARLQRQLARGQRGSRRTRRRRQRLTRHLRHVADRRRHDQHQLTTAIIRQAQVVVVEDLRVASMTRSARGTADAPGSRVAPKAGLNRALLGVGFAEIRRQLDYKSAWHARVFLAVPAPYSSQTCAVCQHRDPASRDTQATFRCTACGHTAHADHNAAQVLAHRGHAALTIRRREPAAAPGTPARDTKARPVRRLRERPATRTHPAVARRAEPVPLTS